MRRIQLLIKQKHLYDFFSHNISVHCMNQIKNNLLTIPTGYLKINT